MFLALDKLAHQGIKKAIIAVPEMSIGGSFADTELAKHGFFADWRVKPENNLCTGSGDDKDQGKGVGNGFGQPLGVVAVACGVCAQRLPT